LIHYIHLIAELIVKTNEAKIEILLVLLAQATTLWLAIRLLLKTQFSAGRMPDVLELILAISGK
jgi:hypothetical protein